MLIKNYLFLCAVGCNRNPTAARIAVEIAAERGLKIGAFYGEYNRLGNLPDELKKNYFDKYDLVFVMESYMYDGLLKLGLQKDKLRCLDIPDEYLRGERRLVDILRNALDSII